MLLRSFAAYLLEQGMDSRYIQELLGYNSPKIAEIYTYVSKKAIVLIPPIWRDICNLIYANRCGVFKIGKI